MYQPNALNVYNKFQCHNKNKTTLFLVVLCVIFASFGVNNAQEFCEVQYTNIPNSGLNVSWLTKNIANEMVSSIPPCIDAATGNLATRICANNKWNPEAPPQCSRIVEYSYGFCPKSEINTNSVEYCHFLTELKDGDYMCKPSDSTTKILSSYIWLPVKRKINYGFYESTNWGRTYGRAQPQYFCNTFNSSLDFLEHDCVVSSGADCIPISCASEMYQHVCQFPKALSLISCPDNCKQSGFAQDTCYCKVNSKSCSQYPKPITTPYEKTILNELANDDLCMITQQTDMVQIIGQDKWFLSNATDFNCSICAFKAISLTRTKAPELILTFQDSSRKLYLKIYNQNLIYNHEDSDYIYCFTNAGENSLKTRVDITKEYEHKDDFVVYSLELERYIGSYWCEALVLSSPQSSKMVFSNKVVAYKEKSGNEFAVRFYVKDICRHINCTLNNNGSILLELLILKDIENIVEQFNVKLRIMEIFEFNLKENFVDFLMHISGKKHSNVIGEYYKLKNNLSSRLPSYIMLKSFLCSDYCMPETDSNHVSWPLGRYKESVPMISQDKVCLDDKGRPKHRVCYGNFLYGLQWSEIDPTCPNNIRINEMTEDLYSVFNSTTNYTSKDIETVSFIMDKYPKSHMGMLEVYFVSEILKNIEVDAGVDVVNVSMNIVNDLLDLEDKTILIEGQLTLNITDTILHAVEDMLDMFSDFDQEVFDIEKENLFVYVFNPLLSNISGVVIYDNHSYQGVKELTMTNLNQTILDDEVELIVILPEDLLFENLSVVVTVYFNDKFFVNNQNFATNFVVNVNFLNSSNSMVFLPFPLPVVFKKHSNSTTSCGFWDYGTKNNHKKGKWAFSGCTQSILQNSSFEVCSFSHLTHFAKLVLKNDLFLGEVTNIHEDILSILTTVLALLSVFGIFGIFLTALIYENWRKKPGTKILMHMCVAILLEIISLYLVELPVDLSIACNIVGIIMHYAVLSKFCWVLIYAVLQYIRFVKVLTPRPKHLVFRSVIFGWGVSLIPVIIVALLTPETYSDSGHHFCYPTDMALFLGIILPILIVLAVNIYIFCIVMYQVSYKTIEINHTKDGSLILQIKLATLLFFVLGIPWMFGILANVFHDQWLKLVLAYVFCFTSTLQGFVLFLFYVIFNKDTRNRWKLFYKQKCFG